MRGPPVTVGGLAVVLARAAASPAAAQAPACDPFTTPSFRGEVPTAQQVIGIGLGDRDVTTAESDRYLLAVDGASARVTSGVAATSVQGRPLRYAIVGRPHRRLGPGRAVDRGERARRRGERDGRRPARAPRARRPLGLRRPADPRPG